MKLQRAGKKLRSGSSPVEIRGFSLVEIMVVLGIAATLAVLVAGTVRSLTQKAHRVECLSILRNLGQGIHLYIQDHGEFPRSQHSASAAGTQPWARAILPYLGQRTTPTTQEWTAIFEQLYRCPSDKNRDVNIYSYALNVFFELTPDGDDYQGSPATWRKPANLPYSASTILLAEPKAVYYADHIMCHLWTGATGAANAVDTLRHDKGANYLFTDGHVETLPLEATFNPATNTNLWHPEVPRLSLVRSSQMPHAGLNIPVVTVQTQSGIH